MDIENFKIYRMIKGGKWYKYFVGPDDIPNIKRPLYWLSIPDNSTGHKLVGYEEYPWRKEDLKEYGRKWSCDSLEKEWHDREEAHKRLSYKAKDHKFEGDKDSIEFDFVDITKYLKKTMPPKGFICTGSIKRRLLFYLEGMGFDISVPIKKYGNQSFPDFKDSLVEDIYIELTKIGHIVCINANSYIIK